MNAHVNFLKTGAEAKALVAKEQHKTTGVPPPGQADDLSKLPVWQRTSTTLGAKFVYGTGAAVLPKVAGVPPIGKKVLKALRAILKEIDWNKHGFVTAFLVDVIFWHHRSTNGRFNDKLGRFERWGVKSVEEWYYHHLPPHPKYPWAKPNLMLSERSFFRIKDKLLDMGLIEAKSRLVRDPVHEREATALWIKPTQELCRIVFEPGYWEKVRGKYAYVKTKKKPRGVHAHKSL